MRIKLGTVQDFGVSWQVVNLHCKRPVRASLPVRLARYALLAVDEVGNIPFEPEAANLFLRLVFSRYERAGLIVTSDKPFRR
jgi:DNA replication protein DnaC